MPNGVELKAERRKPSGEKHRDIENIPSLTGVLAHFRFHEFNAILLHASGPKLAATGAVLRVCFFPPQSTTGIAAVQTANEYEYRFTEYRFAEYEYDEIRCEPRKNPTDRARDRGFTQVKNYRSSTSVQCFVRVSSRTRTQSAAAD
jgi:hypothetical protein